MLLVGKSNHRLLPLLPCDAVVVLRADFQGSVDSLSGVTAVAAAAQATFWLDCILKWYAALGLTASVYCVWISTFKPWTVNLVYVVSVLQLLL